MQAMKNFLLAMTAVLLFMPLPARAGGPDASPNAPKLPRGWQGLTFGMSEDAVKSTVAKLKGTRAKPWERTPLTMFFLPDVEAGRISKVDLDATRVRHWMANDLMNGAATVRAYFDGGKLFAVHVLGTSGFEDFVKRASEAYGAQPRRMKLKLHEANAMSPPAPRDVDVAFWRGNGTTAIIFQPTAWGPELLIASDAGLDAMRALHLRDPRGMGAGGDKPKDATRF